VVDDSAGGCAAVDDCHQSQPTAAGRADHGVDRKATLQERSPSEAPPSAETPSACPPTPSTRSPTSHLARLRTFFGVGLQIARVFPLLIDLLGGAQDNEPHRRRRIALAIADAVRDGARSRASRRFSPTLLDSQLCSISLKPLRLSRRIHHGAILVAMDLKGPNGIQSRIHGETARVKLGSRVAFPFDLGDARHHVECGESEIL
jgi:hypothetical protein